MRIFVFILAFLGQLDVRAEFYIQIKDASDLDRNLMSEYKIYSSTDFYLERSFDEALQILKGYDDFRGAIEFLQNKKEKLNQPLIVTNDENTEVYIFDSSLNYVVNGNGDRISYLSFQDEGIGNHITQSLDRIMTHVFESDLQDQIANNCTNHLFERTSSKLAQAERIQNFLYTVKDMKCQEKLDNGMSLSEYINSGLGDEIFAGCITCLYDYLPEEDIKGYVDQWFGSSQSNQGCKTLIARTVIDKLSKEELKQLFDYAVSKTKSKMGTVIYDHENQGFIYTDPTIVNTIAFSLKFLTEYGAQEVSDSQKEFMTLDTNTLSDESRKEPSDIYADILADFALQDVGENKIVRRSIAKEIISRQIHPSKFPSHDLQVIKLSKSEVSELGEDGVLVTCNTKGNSNAYTKINNNQERLYLDYVREKDSLSPLLGTYIPYSQASLLAANKDSLFVECEDVEYKVNFDKDLSDNQKLNLSSLDNFNFKYGDDGVIEAVSTIGLVKEMDLKLAMGMKFAFLTKGFKLVSEKEVQSVLDNFLVDLETTDIYMPINHSMSLSSFDIGTKNGIEFIFEKENSEGKKVRLKVYTPPYEVSELEKKSRDSVYATSEEIVTSLSKRTNEHNNLMVLNLSCNADKTVPQWMHAYTGALEINVEKEILAPVVISSERSFKTGDAMQIMEHMEYPFGLLDIASREGNIDEVMSFLRADSNSKVKAQRSFAPVSNVGKDYIDRRSQTVGGTVISPDGTEEKF